ncbi:MAG: carboxypeptidase M32 [Verrucomicrobiota bacterium]|nr:carboxypeptidase M32 [Verrucomicrobiota bacterium]
MKNKIYEELVERSKEIQRYQGILTLLHWDQETCMPAGGITARSEQVAQLSAFIHEQRTSRSFKALLNKLVYINTGRPKVKHLSRTQQACLREWSRDFWRATKLPASFVKTFSQVTSEASQIWAMAKKDNNFKLFAPFLKKIIELNQQKAEIWGFEDHPYDALLEAYEPCMTSQRVSHIFDGLEHEIKHLLNKIQDAKKIDHRFLQKTVSEEKQKEIGKWIMSKMPVDESYTRLDISSHPFSMAIHPCDSRITTRHVPNAFMSNIFSVLHESGHSMYEMGLPAEQWGTPLCEAASLSVHESQSRWWETLIGRSLPFWKHHYPELQKILPSHLQHVSLEQFYRAINHVAPSFIRVEADEVTYCLHIILRFDIEKRLISGKLAVQDLPDAWNAKFKELFGMTPPTNAQGCLQDIHWSLGDFGYFPTYALGNILAAQLFVPFAKHHPNWEEQIKKGDLAFIREWLKENVHRHGRLYSLDEIVKKVTGKPLSEAAYCHYLKKKYSEIYHLHDVHHGQGEKSAAARLH